MLNKIIKFLFRNTIEEIIRESQQKQEQQAKDALKVLSKEDLLEYILDNAHVQCHSTTTVLCWRLKQIQETLP